MNSLLLLVALVGSNVYFANLHSHTALSDGLGTPEEAFAYARDSARIDVLALTDHTHYSTPAGYAHTRVMADAANEPGVFVAIAGQEFGILTYFGHIDIFDAESLCPAPANDLAAAYEWLAQQQKPFQYNHPRAEDFDYYRYDVDADRQGVLFEIDNAAWGDTLFFDRFCAALRAGWHVGAAVNQDNHSRNWGDRRNYRGQIFLTGIRADTLTREAVMEAVRSRHTYGLEYRPANDRIYLNCFRIGELEMGDIGTVRTATMRCSVDVAASEDFRQLYLYRNGLLIDSASTDSSGLGTNHPTWSRDLTTDDAYYFVTGEQYDGDRFWSSPIWVSTPPPADLSLEFHPNPLRIGGHVAIVIPDPDKDLWHAECLIADAAGREVATLGQIIERATVIGWDGLDRNGRAVPPGIYLVRVATRSLDDKRRVFTGKLAVKR